LRKDRPGWNCMTHPDEFMAEECNCEVIAFPLPLWDEGRLVNLADIDLLSPWAMELSCSLWIEDAVSPGDAPASLQIGDGRYTGHVPRGRLNDEPWPIPLEGVEHQVAECSSQAGYSQSGSCSEDECQMSDGK
jgi:hypothetical protein